MPDLFHSFFSDTFMPHGYCFQWRPEILWTNVISDFLIAIAYFSIPVAIVIFTRKRQDLEFKGVFVLFALFILCCGVTHLLSIYTMWHASYGLHGIAKAITAGVSVYTAFIVFTNLNQALAIPSIEQLESAIKETASERLKAKQLEVEKKAEAIFRFTTELLPTGLLVVDAAQKIVLSNAALAKMFGYENQELEGRNLSLLLDNDASHHSTLVNNYFDKPEQFHRMASGRVVRGRHKEGHTIDIQINLAVHEYENERHAFASVSDFGSFIFEQSQFNEVSNRMQRAIDASNDGIWEWKVQTGDVWYSPQLMRLIGQSEDQKPDYSLWHDHIHPDDVLAVEAALEHHFETKQKYDISYRGIAENGTYEWFHTRGNAIFDEQGKPIVMSGVISNIHETKLLEERLEEQTQFLDQVLQRSLSGMYLFDLKLQRVTYINPEFTQLTGYTLDELNNLQNELKMLSLVHPDDLGQVRSHLRDVLAGNSETSEGVEYRFKHKNGLWRWLYSKDSVYSYDDEGAPLKMLGSFFDITELKSREQEVRRLALEYSTTFEQAGVGIAHVSLTGEFIKVNARLAQILEYSAEELSRMTFSQITHPEDHDMGTEALRSIRSGQLAVYDTEKRYLCKSGRTIWAHLTVSMVEIEPLTESYFISIVEDISERKDMENKLFASNTSLEQFAYSASHDLQEPLRKISAFSGALEHRLQDQLKDDETRMLLERISNAAVRMGDMVDNLLQLSRASRTPINLESVYLSTCIIQALDDLSHRLQDSTTRIILEQDIKLLVDPGVFCQVVRNILGNSISYKRPDTALEVHISTVLEAGMLVLAFKDNGIGFAPEQSKQIFEPFKRLVGRDIPGTGMGLAICKQIIGAHKGQIVAESPPEGGAIFKIYLPLAVEHET